MNSIYLYGTIGEDWWDENSVTAAQFVKQLNAFGGEPVDIFVNSPGGSVFDGSAIYTAIQRYEGRVCAHIDGLAASAASYCILSADEVLISPSATMMIHDPFMYAQGSADELRAAADALDKLGLTIRNIYVNKTGMPEAEIADLMAAETWFTAEEAISCGLADGYCEAVSVSNNYNKKLLAQYKHVPDALSAQGDAGNTAQASAEPAAQEKPACNTEKTIAGDDAEPATAGKPKVAVFDGRIYEIGEQEC